MSKLAIKYLNQANDVLSLLGLSVGVPSQWMDNQQARTSFKNSVILACLIIDSAANALQCEDEQSMKENGFTDMQDAINCYIQANLDSWTQNDWPESCRDVNAVLSRLSAMVEAVQNKKKKDSKPSIASKIMKSVNLASYALVAAIGVSAIAPNVQAKDSLSTGLQSFVSTFKNAPDMACRDVGSDGNDSFWKVHFNSVTVKDVRVTLTPLGEKSGIQSVINLKRADSDHDMVTYSLYQKIEKEKLQFVTNLVSYGDVSETVLATTAYNDGVAVYTTFINFANCEAIQ